MTQSHDVGGKVVLAGPWSVIYQAGYLVVHKSNCTFPIQFGGNELAAEHQAEALNMAAHNIASYQHVKNESAGEEN